MKYVAVAAVLGAIALLGVGCSSTQQKQNIGQPPTATTTTPVSLSGKTPEEIAKLINFLPNSSIAMKEHFSGLSKDFAKTATADITDGDVVREILITRFAPENFASFDWRITKDTHSTIGKFQNINIKNSPRVLIPGYLSHADRPGEESSGIWLSFDTYQDLKKTGDATVDFTLNDETIRTAFKKVPEVLDLGSHIQSEVDKITKTDVYLLTADPTPSEYPLRVNGQEVKVQVLRARNWFADLVILDNPQNPLILKMTMNSGGIGNVIKDAAWFPSLFSYEINTVEGVAL